MNTYPEHATHVRHARRAGRDQIGLVGGAYERQQTSPVAFGVRDAVDDASVPHGGRWAEHGDTIGRPIKRGTAGHSLPPLRLVRRSPGECRIGVEISRLRRNLLDAPRADVLIEGSGILHRSEGRASVWSE